MKKLSNGTVALILWNVWKIILIGSLLLHAAGCADGPPETGTWTESGDQVNPPVDPPAPFACKAGATVEVGPSADFPAIAGTDTGYALVYRETSTSREANVLVFDREGDPTGPATLLLGSNYAPQLTSGHDGYVVQSGGSFYWVGQDGAVGASALNAQWAGMSVDMAESGLRGVTLTDAPECTDGPYPFRFSVIDLDRHGNNGVPTVGPCMTYGWWMNGFAAHDDSALFMDDAITSTVGTRSDLAMTVNVFADGGYRQFVLATGYTDETSWDVADVSRAVATEDGYAVLWHRYVYDGPIQLNRAFLTFIDRAGEFRGTVEVDRFAKDIVWNGREFGLVCDAFVDDVRSLVFERLDGRGQTLETIAIPVGVDFNNTPKIAAGNDGFAIAYGDDHQGTFDLAYVTITCQ